MIARLRRRLKDLKRYPSLFAGIVIIGLFFVASTYAVIAIPYNQAIDLWKGGPGVWDESPRLASPIWFDYLTREQLSRTIVVPFGEGVETVEPIGEGMARVEITLPFRFAYDTFPQGLGMFTETTSGVAVGLYWHTPDGRIIVIKEDYPVRIGTATYQMDQDIELRSRLGGVRPRIALFADPENDGRTLRGDYQLVIRADVPAGEELAVKLVVYGEVHGWAGTDHRQRDLMVALLWGAPIGLLFGVLAAIGAQLSTFVLAGISTWFGGKLERVFQWVTQVNLVLPVLPILIMVGHFYSSSIWTMLGMIISLNVFSAAMLTYRAMFLQAKEAPYFEAAQAYGTGNLRIVFRYLLPRIAPTLLPQFVLVIPTFVFLEATLAVLGLGDPVLPTWGKVLNDGHTQGALFKGYYYWIIQPAVLLMTIGVGFALVGYSLDRIFNPRLRTV